MSKVESAAIGSERVGGFSIDDEIDAADGSGADGVDFERRHGVRGELFAHPVACRMHREANRRGGAVGATGLEGAEEGSRFAAGGPNAGVAGGRGEVVAGSDESEKVSRIETCVSVGFDAAVAKTLEYLHEGAVYVVTCLPKDAVHWLVRDGEGVLIEFFPELRVGIVVRAEHIRA